MRKITKNAADIMEGEFLDVEHFLEMVTDVTKRGATVRVRTDEGSEYNFRNSERVEVLRK